MYSKNFTGANQYVNIAAMEMTSLTIQLPTDVSRELEKKAKTRGRPSSELAAEMVSNGLKIARTKRSTASEKAKSALTVEIVDKTFGVSGPLNRKVLISLAEDEEFSGY